MKDIQTHGVILISCINQCNKLNLSKDDYKSKLTELLAEKGMELTDELWQTISEEGKEVES